MEGKNGRRHGGEEPKTPKLGGKKPVEVYGQLTELPPTESSMIIKPYNSGTSGVKDISR